MRDEREVQARPAKLMWLFEPYLQDLYERRQWNEINAFESSSVGARLVAALVLATARTGELVTNVEQAELVRFHAERRKWLVTYMFGRTCDAECRGKLVDVMLSTYGEAQGDYDEALQKLVQLPRSESGPAMGQLHARLLWCQVDADDLEEFRDRVLVPALGRALAIPGSDRTMVEDLAGSGGDGARTEPTPWTGGAPADADRRRAGRGGQRRRLEVPDDRCRQGQRSVGAGVCNPARDRETRTHQSTADDQEGQLLRRRANPGPRLDHRAMTERDARPLAWGMTRYQWTVLFAAWLGWGFDVFDGLLFNYVAPNCVPTLLGLPLGSVAAKKATLFWGGTLTSILLLGWAAGGILFGAIADRIGRTRTLMLTMLLYALGTAACAAAPNLPVLILFRLVASLGIGGEWAAGAAMVAEVVPERRRVEAGRAAVHVGADGTVLGDVRQLPDRGRVLQGVARDIVAIRVLVWTDSGGGGVRDSAVHSRARALEAGGCRQRHRPGCASCSRRTCARSR